MTESREAAFAPPGPQRSPGRLTRSKTSSSGTPCVKPTNACETHRQSPKVTGCGPAGGGPFPCILNQENGACPAPGDVCCRASSAHDYGGSNRNEIKIMGALLITHHMGFPFCFPSPPPPSPLPGRSGRLGSGWCSGVDLYFCSQVRRPFRPPHCGTAAGGAALPQTNNININPWTPAGPQPPVGLLVGPPH